MEQKQRLPYSPKEQPEGTNKNRSEKETKDSPANQGQAGSGDLGVSGIQNFEEP